MVMTTTSANEMQGENRARDFTQSKVGRSLELLSRISLSSLSVQWGDSNSIRFEMGADRAGPKKSEDEFVGAALIRGTGFISGRGRRNVRACIRRIILFVARAARLGSHGFSDPYSSS